MNNNQLEHAVINQLEADFNDLDFDSMSEMLELLIKNEKNQEILFQYLSDTTQQNFIEGRTNCRY